MQSHNFNASFPHVLGHSGVDAIPQGPACVRRPRNPPVELGFRVEFDGRKERALGARFGAIRLSTLAEGVTPIIGAPHPGQIGAYLGGESLAVDFAATTAAIGGCLGVMFSTRRDQIPCASYLVEGLVRGASLGLIWGACADLELLEAFFCAPATASAAASGAAEVAPAFGPVANRPSLSLDRVVRRTRVLGRSGAAFALFLGAFAGGNCTAQTVTGLDKDHWMNAFVGGFAGGSAFAWLLNSVSWWRMGALTGSFAATVRYIHHPGGSF